MGATPKHRVSKTQQRKRRTHFKVAPVTLARCSQCFEMKRAHRVCKHCGYYDKKIKVIEVAKD